MGKGKVVFGSVLGIILMMNIVSAIVHPIDIYREQSQVASFIKAADIVTFEYEGYNIEAKVMKVEDTFLELSIRNVAERKFPKKLNLVVGDKKPFDLNDDLKDDVVFSLVNIEEKKASMAITKVIPVAAEKSGNQTLASKKALTPEEKEKAAGSAQQLLQYAPYITNGLMLMNGKLTFFNFAKNQAITYGIGALSESNPNMGVAYQTYQAFDQLGDAVSSPKREPPVPTGAAIALNDGFLLTAFNGNDFYHNFYMASDTSEKLSFLFKYGTVYGNKVNVYKDFDDENVQFGLFGEGNLDVNSNLFINMEGKAWLSKVNAAVRELRVKSLKDNNLIDLAGLEENPFVAVVDANGVLIFEDILGRMQIDDATAEFQEQGYTVTVEDMPITTIGTKVVMDAERGAQRRKQMAMLKMKGGTNIEIGMERGSRLPVVKMIKPSAKRDWNVLLEKEESKMSVSPLREGVLILRGGKVYMVMNGKEKRVVVDTKNGVVVSDETNRVKLGSLAEGFQSYNHIKDVFLNKRER